MMNLRIPVDRQISGLPLYVQIAEALLEQIESGEFAPGDRLPTERALSERLSVNRMTVRNALHVLEMQGLIIRRQGAGTYVAEPKIEREASQLISFTREMQRRGLKPGGKVIALEQRPAEASVASQLGIAPSAMVYYLIRLRLINQEPVLLERNNIPLERFPRLERHDLESRSLYEVMQEEYGVVVQRARQSLEPVLANEFEAELLMIEPGAALMLERRISYDDRDRPVEHGKDLYRGDRFLFVTELAPLED